MYITINGVGFFFKYNLNQNYQDNNMASKLGEPFINKS